MVNVYFASYRENAYSGWSARMLLMGGDPEKNGCPFDAAYDSKSASGRSEEGPTLPLTQTVGRINADQEIKLFIPSGRHSEKNIDVEEVREMLTNKGHASVDVQFVDVEMDGLQFKKRDILPNLIREARAACWGVPLNNLNYVPGTPISSEEAQELHIKAGNSGFEPGAFRFLLSRHGLISAKEVTDAIHHKIRRFVESDIMANIYNNKYQKILANRNHRAIARDKESVS